MSSAVEVRYNNNIYCDRKTDVAIDVDGIEQSTHEDNSNKGKQNEEPEFTKTIHKEVEGARHKKDVSDEEKSTSSSKESNERSEEDEESQKDDEDDVDSPRKKKHFIKMDEEDFEDVVEDKVTQKQQNSYAAKKTAAQGMMDIALLTANANQLRYVVEFNSQSPTYYLHVSLISISLLLQVGVGVSLIFRGRMDMKGPAKHEKAKFINNIVLVGVFLVTIINIFIASFTIAGKPQD